MKHKVIKAVYIVNSCPSGSVPGFQEAKKPKNAELKRWASKDSRGCGSAKTASLKQERLGTFILEKLKPESTHTRIRARKSFFDCSCVW
jgi:hypothetical protein